MYKMRNPILTKSEASRSDKFVDWVFTLNNYKAVEFLKIKEYPCEYLIVSEEIAPTTNTPHLQGFWQFSNAKAFSTLKKQFPRLYLAKRKGTPKQAADYCKYLEYPELKGENPKLFEKGELITRDQQGSRTDLAIDAKNILDGTITAKQLLRTNPMKYHLYGRTYEKLQDLAYEDNPRTTPCEECLYIFGPTGTGKSWDYWMNEYATNPKKFYKYPNDKEGWCDNYKQEEVFVIDEFRGEITFKMILELANQLGFCLKRRGRAPIPFTSKKIIITSALPIDKVFKNLDSMDRFDQFYRRFTVINKTSKYSKGVILDPLELIKNLEKNYISDDADSDY